MTESSSAARCRPELAVIVPTYNEAANLVPLLERLRAALAEIDWEIILVDDDSPDGTAQLARDLACHEPRLRVMQRIGRRGLASACLEGLLASAAPYLAVIDADLQHDEALLPQMLAQLRAGDVDLVVASRYVAGGDIDGWSARRAAMSRLATRIAQRLTGVALHDPMSGFFMLRAAVVHNCAHRLSGVGFKLLLDICLHQPQPLRCAELPYRFRPRQAGLSKLDHFVLWEYGLMLVHYWLGPAIPARFIGFALIGTLGVGVHFFVLWLLFKTLGLDFIFAQAVATLVAMTSNFLLNNELTYRDLRLRGRELLRGWLAFVAACSLGAVANVGIAHALFQAHSPWMLSALAGILIGAVWNYAVTAVYTWRRRG